MGLLFRTARWLNYLKVKEFCAKSIFRPNTHSWRLILSSDKTNSNLKLIYPAIVNPCALTRKDSCSALSWTWKTSGSKETQLLSSGWRRTHMRDKLIWNISRKCFGKILDTCLCSGIDFLGENVIKVYCFWKDSQPLFCYDFYKGVLMMKRQPVAKQIHFN